LGGTSHFRVESQGRLFRNEDRLVKEMLQQSKQMQQQMKKLEKIEKEIAEKK
jgi:hypothetical protein